MHIKERWQMYFWNIKALKYQLAHDGLSQKDSLKYLLFLSVIGATPIPKPPFFSDASIIHHLFGIVILMLGTIYCYKKNAGSIGIDFLSRYISLTFVVLIRLLPFAVILGLIPMTGILPKLEDNIQETIMWTLLYLIVIFWYWRVGYHISEVSFRKLDEVKNTA